MTALTTTTWRQILRASFLMVTACLTAPLTCAAQEVTSPPITPSGVSTPTSGEPAPVIPTKKTRLYNGKDFSGFYSFLPSKGINSDPEKIFTVTPEGWIHILGKEVGYIATAVPYADYQLTFEVKWGEKQWPPRDKGQPRDSGVLVHFVGKDKVWPQSFECQVQENDMGDIFLLGGISAMANGKRQNGRVVRKRSNEKPRGEWNKIEIICKGDSVTSIVNGMVGSEATELTRGKDGTGGILASGKILFQSEWADVYDRNIEIRPVTGKNEKFSIKGVQTWYKGGPLG